MKGFPVDIKFMLKKILQILFFSLTLFSKSFSQSGEWEIIGKMPVGLTSAEAVVYNDKIYIIGGYSDSLGLDVNWIWSFNPVNKLWKLESLLPDPRTYFAAGAFSDGIYYCSGSDDPVNSDILYKWDYGYMSQPEAVDNNSSLNRLFSANVQTESSIYLFGGLTDDNSKNFAVKISIGSDISYSYMSYSGSLLFAPLGQAAAALNDYIYLFGGSVFGVERTILKVDKNLTGIKELSVSLSVPRIQARAVTDNTKNNIYIIGGGNENQFSLNTVEILHVNPLSVTISDGPSLNFPRRDFMSVIYDNKIYVFGGFDNQLNTVREIEVLDLLGTGIEDDFTDNATDDFRLYQNYPNPFSKGAAGNQSTAIEYEIFKPDFVELDIYSVTGELIKNLYSGYQTAGRQQAIWNGEKNSGELAAAGIYFYVLKSGTFFKSKSMILLK